MDNQFKQYQLKPFVIAGLDAMGITQPTPIQKKVIPALLRGENLVGQSQTGSGKTQELKIKFPEVGLKKVLASVAPIEKK